MGGKAPTAVRVLEILEPLTRTHIIHDRRTLTVVVVEPVLTPLTPAPRAARHPPRRLQRQLSPATPVKFAPSPRPTSGT